MSFTVVPLHHLALQAGTRIQFGPDFVLQDIPDWLRSDKGILDHQSLTDRQMFNISRHAFVVEYDADSIGAPDPKWKGKKPKSIQECYFQTAMLANLTLWVQRPSPVCFSLCFHAISWKQQDGPDLPITQQVQRHSPLSCHPNNSLNALTPQDLAEASPLFEALRTLRTDSPVWVAVRFIWEGLTSYRVDFRYTHFWIGLEALFGAEDSGETSYKIALRIALFLADTPESARELFKKVKRCYGVRSKIVHGRWKHDPKMADAIIDTEAIVRQALRKVLKSPHLVEVFSSKNRDEFLESWVFSRALKPSIPEP